MLNNSNLPAYPCENETTSYQGLSKREAMAMAAMQGFVTGLRVHDDWNRHAIALWAVQHADALLAELEKKS